MPLATWTIIILINNENNLLTNTHRIYDDIVRNYGDSTLINIVLIIDQLRIEIDPTISANKYSYLRSDKFRNLTIYKINQKDFQNLNYVSSTPYFEENNHERDNLYKICNVEFYLRMVKTAFPAQHYGFIYKSHGGQTTDINSKFVESYLLRLEAEEIYCYGESKPEKYFINTNNVIQRLSGKWRTHDEKDWAPPTFDVIETKKGTAIPEEVLIIYIGKDSKALSYNGMNDALKKNFTSEELQFVVLDCCWGMRLEMIDLFKDTCKYFVASADESSSAGIGYGSLTRYITDDPSIKPDELAKLIIANYYIQQYKDYINPKDSEDKTFFYYGISFTCVDNSFYESTSNLFKLFCFTLTNLLKIESCKDEFFDILKHCRRKCKDYTYYRSDVYHMYNIDIIWFTENLIASIEKSENKHDFLRLHKLSLELIVQLKLKLILAFTHNNYKIGNTEDNESYLGGYGLTITFPKKSTAILDKQIVTIDSILYNDERANYPFFEESGWGQFMHLYHNYLTPERP